MSVINKMLRDLDRRHCATPAPAPPRPVPGGIAQGTVAVNPLAQPVRTRALPRFVILGGVVTLLAAGVVATWWFMPLKATPPPVMAVTVSAVAAVLPHQSAPMVTTAPVVQRAAPAVTPVATAVMALPVKKPATAQAASIPVHAPLPSVAPQALHPVPTLDALAQAQSLWSAGSRAPALALLRDAVALLERVSPVGAPAANTAVLAPLARELARMEMAEGHVSQALSMLTRLEPALSELADIWAIRGNAAQRLGRHDESVAAYQAALKLKPNEPRWMLGAAVSLAALGQTAPAAELAEKARTGGALSPEVGAYLKQLGVPLREH